MQRKLIIGDNLQNIQNLGGLKMKKFLIASLIIVMTFAGYSQNEYPYFGTKEWKKLPIKIKIETLQLNPIELNNISTYELVNRCLNFPFITEILLIDNYQQGFEIIRENFNGLKELFTRKDAGKSILKVYNSIDSYKLSKNFTSAQRGKISHKITFLEIFLVQPEILNQFKFDKKPLIDAFLKKYRNMIKYNANSEKILYSKSTLAALGAALLKIINSTDYIENLKTDFDDYTLKRTTNELNINFITENRLIKILEIANKISNQ